MCIIVVFTLTDFMTYIYITYLLCNYMYIHVQLLLLQLLIYYHYTEPLSSLLTIGRTPVVNVLENKKL